MMNMSKKKIKEFKKELEDMRTQKIGNEELEQRLSDLERKFEDLQNASEEQRLCSYCIHETAVEDQDNFDYDDDSRCELLGIDIDLYQSVFANLCREFKWDDDKWNLQFEESNVIMSIPVPVASRKQKGD